MSAAKTIGSGKGENIERDADLGLSPLKEGQTSLVGFVFPRHTRTDATKRLVPTCSLSAVETLSNHLLAGSSRCETSYKTLQSSMLSVNRPLKTSLEDLYFFCSVRCLCTLHWRAKECVGRPTDRSSELK